MRTVAPWTGLPPADTCPPMVTASCAATRATGIERAAKHHEKPTRVRVICPRERRTAQFRSRQRHCATSRYGVKPSTTYCRTMRIAAVLSPSSPPTSGPQHATEPSVGLAQVCATPAAMDVKRSPPATGVGFVFETTELSPSCPNWLLPQQYAEPFAVSPHAWKLPTVSEVKIGAVS